MHINSTFAVTVTSCTFALTDLVWERGRRQENINTGCSTCFIKWKYIRSVPISHAGQCSMPQWVYGWCDTPTVNPWRMSGRQVRSLCDTSRSARLREDWLWSILNWLLHELFVAFSMAARDNIILSVLNDSVRTVLLIVFASLKNNCTMYSHLFWCSVSFALGHNMLEKCWLLPVPFCFAHPQSDHSSFIISPHLFFELQDNMEALRSGNTGVSSFWRIWKVLEGHCGPPILHGRKKKWPWGEIGIKLTTFYNVFIW